MGPFWKTFNYIVSILTHGDFNDQKVLRETYRNHYRHVREVVPEEKLLEFNPGDGYQKLCDFLGEPRPDKESYPHINQPDNIIRVHTKLWRFTVINAVVRVGGGIGAVAAVAGAMWYYRYRL